MSVYTPANIHSTVNSYSAPSNTGRYGLVDGLMRKGIMYNLDKYRFVSNLLTRETVRKGQMFEEWIRYSNMGSEFHKLGTQIIPQEQKRKRYRIFLDERPRVTSASFDDWEDFVSNVPHQAQAADRMANELGDQMEIESIKQAILAARDTGNLSESDQFRGGGLTGAGNPFAFTSQTTAAGQAASLLSAIDVIDENWFNINSKGTDMYVLIDSPIWYAARGLEGVFPMQTSVKASWTHGDIGVNAGPRPDQFAGPDAMLVYKGFKIVRSNLASQVFSVDRSDDMYRAGNFGNRGTITVDTSATATASDAVAETLGIVFKPDAAAIVEASSPKFESFRRPDFQTTQTFGSMLMGGGSLYSENAVELVRVT